MKYLSSHNRWLSLVLCFIALSLSTHAQLIDLQPPQDGTFIQDHANLIDATTVKNINAVANPLFTESKIPIYVITIDSMADHNGKSMRIETFANTLFDKWGIGFKQLDNISWNRGILLLVSKDDRKARIELGADWTHKFDRQCQIIMDHMIVPNFKRGNYAKGILEGVTGLEKMSQHFLNPQTSPPITLSTTQLLFSTNSSKPTLRSLMPVLLFLILVILILWLIYDRTSGNYFERNYDHNNLLHRRNRRRQKRERKRKRQEIEDYHTHNSYHDNYSSGGGSSSGFFGGGGGSGGGFSGGGGATGSW